MNKQNIVAFDFDGTITTKDTLLLFIGFAKGKTKLYFGFLLHLPLLLAYKLKLYPNQKLKQRIFSYFFKGTDWHTFNKTCEDFSIKYQNIIRPKAVDAISKYIENNYDSVIVSASIKNWVEPFARQLKIPNVLCTELEIDNNNLLTGRFSTPNCYGPEKVKRLMVKYPAREKDYLIAYGDSKGDKELLEFADEKYYKEFE
jgi:HAD superfamily hydrolase (TIGR01490 family)